jgi:hypothetical protein
VVVRHALDSSWLRTLLRCVALFALLLTSACATQPVVRLHHANLLGASPMGLRFDVVLEVENRNPFDVEVRSVRGNPSIAGTRGLGPMALEPRQWLPAGRAVLIAVPISVPWPVAASVALEALSRGEVSYRFVGVADVTATRALRVEWNQYPIDIEGELPASFFASAGGGGLQFGVGR